MYYTIIINYGIVLFIYYTMIKQYRVVASAHRHPRCSDNIEPPSHSRAPIPFFYFPCHFFFFFFSLMLLPATSIPNTSDEGLPSLFLLVFFFSLFKSRKALLHRESRRRVSSVVRMPTLLPIFVRFLFEFFFSTLNFFTLFSSKSWILLMTLATRARNNRRTRGA